MRRSRSSFERTTRSEKRPSRSEWTRSKQAVPLVTDRAVIASSVLMVEALASQMKTTLAAIAEFDSEIAALVRRQRGLRAHEELAGSWAELRREAGGGAGHGQGAVAVSRRVGATLRHRACHRAQREELPGAGGATSARSSCARASTSTRANRSGIRSGRGPTTTGSGRRGRAIRRRCERWPSSGSESSTDVGRRERLTMR